MKIEVIMPKMGESLQEGTITKWLKKTGDTIERDEMILEISTDKVDTEVPSPVGGILAEILFNENDTVEVGKVIAFIETEAGAAATPARFTQDVEKPIEVKVKSKTVAPAEHPNTFLVDVVMPKMGESLQEGTITKWLKNVGEEIERDEMILEISTDKVDTEVPSPVGGVLAEILYKENETIEVGKVIARIATAGSVASLKDTPKKTETPVPSLVTTQESVVTTQTVSTEPDTKEIPRESDGKFFSPLVRSIAEKENITLNELKSITGSGVEGRITKNDLINYINKKQSAPIESIPIVSQPEIQIQEPQISEPSPKPLAPAASVPTILGAEDEVIPMDRMRQLIAEHMVYSKHTSPHVTSVAEADVTNIVKYRNKFKESFEKREGYKLTYTPFFAKAAIEGIKAFPRVNVSVDGKNIIQHRRVHLSFATALEDGNLIVPVIKNADALGMTGLARAVFDLSTRARTKKLNPDDIQGGTFTITNVGTFGTLFGTPVINQPQTAIMGIGAIKKRPVVKEFDGEDLIVVRDMAYVSITYDHRVIDGMLAGQCLAAIVRALETMTEENIDI